MFNLKGALSTFLTVVAFLVLTVLAARFYGDTNSKTNLEKSSAYQKGQAVVGTVWSYAKIIAGINVIKNVGVGNASLETNIKNEFDIASEADFANSDETETSPSGFLSDFSARVKKELSNPDSFPDTAAYSNDDANSDLKDVDLKSEINSMFSYNKTSEGAEIIIKSKSGREYKLPLPFKFLAEQSKAF